MTHTDVLRTLTPTQKAQLNARSDLAGLRHLALYLAAMGASGAYVLSAGPLWQIAFAVYAALLVFLFTLSHECTHQTPFRTAALNECVGHAIAPLMCLPFVWFRYFHLAHHKHTNDPDRDPEIAGHPRPDNWRSYLIYLSGWGYWSGGLRVLWSNAFGRIDAPYLPERRHREMQIEARVILLIQCLALLSLSFSSAAFWLWILPAVLGQPLLRLYLLAEHGLCPPVADMLENTRTTYTNRLIRFVAWNMPYHIEHHAAPNVPFHQLPALHSVMRPHLKSTSDGYSNFTKDYIKQL